MDFISMLRFCTAFVLFYFIAKLAANNKFSKTLSSKNSLRIHGGSEVVHGEYPFVVILTKINMFYGESQRLCTGSMLTEQWGLTAAHCSLMHNEYYVWYGNFTFPPVHTQLISKVLKLVIHPSFRCLSLNKRKDDLLVENDVGLFHVQKLNLKNFGALLSADYTSLTGLPVTFVGSGMTRYEKRTDDRYRPLQYGEATIINCDDEMRSKSKYIICLAPKCSNRLQRPWYGDSGGPLLCDGKIIGVCSYGIESKIMARMAYAPVSPYIDWIHDVINTTM